MSGAVVAVAVVIALWALVASPRARWRGPVATPVAKVAVFGGAGLGLALTGSGGMGAGLVGAAVLLSALARTPEVRALAAPVPAADDGGRPASG
ncbi:DUF2568 domain-containing protein [Serinibacter arcticus]|uniref:DUF2568 domain-containing protein n=1 Tax=Serinibacter arcticus TaxID=1655435 RepID=UPI0013049984|nr:DUF2568 domain-containing protein [Serinibacter arcticus]